MSGKTMKFIILSLLLISIVTVIALAFLTPAIQYRQRNIPFADKCQTSSEVSALSITPSEPSNANNVNSIISEIQVLTGQQIDDFVHSRNNAIALLDDNNIVIWNMESGLKSSISRKKAIVDIDISPNGQCGLFLEQYTSDTTWLILFDLDTSQMRLIPELSNTVETAYFTVDGAFISYDNSNFWKITTRTK